MIEAFCMLYTGDVLNIVDDPVSPVSASSSSGTSATTASPDAKSAPAVPASSPGSAAAVATAASQANLILGAKYRTSLSYRRHNINLMTSTSGEDGERVNSVHRTQSKLFSLRRQTSFGSLASRDSNGSIVDMAGVSNTFLSPSQRLMMFASQHAGVLNLLIRSKPSLLEDCMAAFIRVVQLRSVVLFEHKKKYFYDHLRKYKWSHAGSRRSRGSVHMTLNRDRIFEDSFRILRDRSAEDLRGRLQVNYEGEEGVDAGGLSREWYQMLAREIFNPNYCLFSSVDGATFQPNPMSNINMNHLDYFKFVGRVIGKAVLDRQLMDAHFTRSFYKHLLGVAVDYVDIEALEPDYYKSLKQIIEFPMDVLGIELTFSAESQTFGKTKVIDLIENGRNILVTDENKVDYVKLISKHRMTTAIKSQIECFMDGFYEMVPPELISLFTPTELELLISGLPDVDIEDLYTNTEYQQFTVSEPYMIWFWNILRAFNREEKALFLQFVTGTSKVSMV